MANVKITDLDLDTAPASTDVLPFVDISSDETKKVTVEDLLESAGDGAVATPAFSFASDKNTGIYRPGADQLALATGGTNRLFINSSGNIGVNTSNPSVKFHAAGTARVGANDASDAVLEIGAGATGNRNAFIDLTGDTTYSDYGLRIQRDNSGANTSSRFLHRGTGDFRFITQEAAPIQFWTSNSQKAVITSAGLLGVGISSPAAKLHTVGTVLHEGDVEIRPENTGGEGGQITLKNPDKTSTGATIDVSSANAFRIFQLNDNSVMELGQLGGTGGVIKFATSGSTAMTIDSSQNLLIGTTTNARGKLTVFNGDDFSTATSGNGDNIYLISDAASGDNVYGASISFSRAQYADRKLAAIAAVQTSSDEDHLGLAFFTHPSSNASDPIVEAMRIDAEGALSIFNGTAPTASATNGVKLYAEDVSSSSELKVRDEAGNVTTLSPHNFDLIPEGPSEDMAWSYYSERDGKRINVDMLKAVRLLEQLSGEKLVFTS